MSGASVDADRLVTQSELAEIRGVTRQYINKLAAQGRLGFIDGKIMLSDALAQLGTAEDDDEDSPGYAAARAETERWRGKQARLNYERDAGQLVRADQVDAAVFNAFFELREKVTGALPDMARRAMRAGSEREAMAIVEEAMDDVFTAVADAFERRWKSKAG